MDGVEIDTLWNVKYFTSGDRAVLIGVEIDTLWNVKVGECGGYCNAYNGRNRYIVECKDY